MTVADVSGISSVPVGNAARSGSDRASTKAHPSSGAPVFWIPSVNGSYQGPTLQQSLEHDIPLLEKGVGA